jgi:hypothetical protein
VKNKEEEEEDNSSDNNREDWGTECPVKELPIAKTGEQSGQ